jgi:hypothetical protein
MNIITVIGVILAVLGAIGLIYGGITYTSGRDEVDVGSMHVQVSQERHIPMSPIAGAVALAAGVILIVLGRKRTASGQAA